MNLSLKKFYRSKINFKFIIAHLFFLSVIFNNFIVSGQLLGTDFVVLFFSIYFLMQGNWVSFYKNKEFVNIIILSIIVILINLGYKNFSAAYLRENFRLLEYTLFFLIYKIFLDKDNSNFKLYYSAYINIALLCSIFILFQSILFYLFRQLIYIDFGSQNLMANSVRYAFSAGIIRSGGFFREPNWYILFCFPYFFSYLNKKKDFKFFIILLALLLSTSSVVLFLIPFFFLYESFSGMVKRQKINLSTIIFIIFFLFSLVLIARYYPVVFDRFIFFLQTGGSSGQRIGDGLSELIKLNEYSLLGRDVSYFDGFNYKFLSSGSFILLDFGIFFGSLFIYKFFLKKIPFPYIIIILIYLFSEGFIGRIDFWLVLPLIKGLSRNPHFQVI